MAVSIFTGSETVLGIERSGVGWVEKGNKMGPLVLETLRILAVVVDSEPSPGDKVHTEQNTHAHMCKNERE